MVWRKGGSGVIKREGGGGGGRSSPDESVWGNSSVDSNPMTEDGPIEGGGGDGVSWNWVASRKKTRKSSRMNYNPTNDERIDTILWVVITTSPRGRGEEIG